MFNGSVSFEECRYNFVGFITLTFICFAETEPGVWHNYLKRITGGPVYDVIVAIDTTRDVGIHVHDWRLQK